MTIEMFWAIVLFIVGLLMLIKGGDWFVDGATGIARRFKLPEILIGATVVSIGTTLPEVMVSAGGAMSGYGSMAYGNAIGSIICNTALIAALTIAIKPSKCDRKTLILPVSFFFVAAIFYVAIAYITQDFARWVGIVLLAIFVIYMVVNAISMFKNKEETEEEVKEETPLEKLPFKQELWAELKGERTSVVKEIILLIVGAVVIAFGADFLVDNGTFIANEIGIPETVIALTFVALGTSLPELVTAITSLVKGHSSLSLGNIIGANLFNLVLVSGVSVAIAPFAVPTQATLFGFNASFIFEIPVMLSVMLILTVPALIRNKLSRVQGITLLTIMVLFYVCQFVLVQPIA
jgi:cation:H+ antiporter